MILKAEDFRRRSFGDLDKNKDGFVDAAVSSVTVNMVTATVGMADRFSSHPPCTCSGYILGSSE
jgi:hypothetical protein